MNILALDTCTEMCSAAVLKDGKLFEQAELTQRGHSEKILGMMDDVLAQADCSLQLIDLIAFGRGPGSFTGVRVGVAVAQGIAFARQLPVVPVSTLAAVAQRAIDEHQAEQIAVALDARMGEIYAAHFRAVEGYAQLCDQEQVCAPELFKPMQEGIWFAAGSGWREYDDVLQAGFAGQVNHKDVELMPTAGAIARLAKLMAEQGFAIAADQAVPVYLRDNVARKKGEQ